MTAHPKRLDPYSMQAKRSLRLAYTLYNEPNHVRGYGANRPVLASLSLVRETQAWFDQAGIEKLTVLRDRV